MFAIMLQRFTMHYPMWITIIDQAIKMRCQQIIRAWIKGAVISVLALLFVFNSTAAELPSHQNFATEILFQTTNPINKKFYELITKNSNQELREFLDRGADPNVTDDYRVSPIHYASFFGNLNALYILIAHGAKVTASPYGGWSPLHYAAFAGHKSIVAALLTAEVPVDQKDDGGETALFYAVKIGDMEIVHLLVEAGASVNSVNQHSKTPLDFAVQFHQLDIASYLESKGAKSGREIPMIGVRYRPAIVNK